MRQVISCCVVLALLFAGLGTQVHPVAAEPVEHGQPTYREAERFRPMTGFEYAEPTYAAYADGAQRPAPRLPVVSLAPAVEPGPSRLAGASRWATAAAVSRATTTAPADVVLVASGQDFPDALAGGPAAAKLGAPLLLTAVDALPADTRAELQRLRPERVVVLGGAAAVSAGVEGELRELAGSVERLWGPDRFATAAAISERVFQRRAERVSDPNEVRRAYVATGLGFADALSAGAAAGREGAPLLLVADRVPAATVAELDRLDINEVVVVGGASAVSEEVAAALADGDRRHVRRLSGPDRLATNAAIAEAAFDAADTGTVLLATAGGFPDALAAVPAAVALGGPVLLAVDEHSAAAAGQSARLAPSSAIAVGGTAVVPDAALGAVWSAAASALRDVPDGALEASADGDVTALATALGPDPFAQAEFVRHHVEANPWRAGLARAPWLTLQEGQGNAWEIAELLAALLRASGTQVRFATGRVLLDPAVATGWIGVADPFVAAQVLASARMNTEVLTPRGATTWFYDEQTPILGIVVDHAWVEASIDGDWVPLDVGIVGKQAFAGRNLYAEAGIDAQDVATELLDRRIPPDHSTDEDATESERALAAARIGGFVDDGLVELLAEREAQMLAWLEEHEPDVSLRDTLGTSRPITAPVRGPIQPWREIYQDEVEHAEELPAEQRHRVTIEMPGYEYEADLADLLGRRVTVDFVAGSPEDQQELDDRGGVLGPNNAPLELRPRLLVDGEAVGEPARFTGRVNRPANVTVANRYDQWNDRVSYQADYGGSYALMLGTDRVPVGSLEAARARLADALDDGADPFSDAVLGEMLHALGIAYWAAYSQEEQVLAGSAGALAVTGLRMGIVSHNLTPDPDTGGYALGAFSYDLQAPLGIFPRTAGDFDRFATRFTIGAVSSMYEASLLERGLGLPTTSTIEDLFTAHEEDWLIAADRDNNREAIQALPLGAFNKVYLDSDVSSGMRLVAPERRWDDADRLDSYAYMLYDPETGEAQWAIAGGMDGGAAVIAFFGLSAGAAADLLVDLALGFDAFLEGLILGDFSERAFDDPLLSGAFFAGQLVSSLLVYGDVRDIAAALGSISAGDGSWSDVAILSVALLPGMSGLRGLRLVDDVGAVALRSGDGFARLGSIAGDDAARVAAGLRRNLPRDAEIIVSSAYDLAPGVRAISARADVAGLPVENVFVGRAGRDAYLQRVGVAQGQLPAELRSGRAAERVADDLAARNGWSDFGRFREAGPTTPGIDRVYRTSEGRFVIVEAKVNTGAGRLGPGRMRGAGDQYELSDAWLTQPSSGDGLNAIQRSVEHGKLTPSQGDELLAAVRAGDYDRQVIVLRTAADGRTVTRTLGPRTGLETPPATSVVVVDIGPGT